MISMVYFLTFESYVNMKYLQNLVVFNSYFLMTFQIQGKFYFRFDPLGEGAKWRRTVGQEIYSPLLLAFAEQVK